MFNVTVAVIKDYSPKTTDVNKKKPSGSSKYSDHEKLDPESPAMSMPTLLNLEKCECCEPPGSR